MFLKIKWLVIIAVFSSTFFLKSLSAQTSDITWLSVKLNTKLNENWSLAFRPIQRTNLSTTSYSNTSIDVSATRKLSKQFSAQLLVRQFLVPGEPPDRTFFWTNLIHSAKLKPFTFKNILRHHWGINVHQKEADFMRWIPQIGYQFTPKVKLFIQSDLFFQFNQFNKVRQVRYQGGIHSKVSESLALNFQYWRQNSVNKEPAKRENIYVLNLIYSVSKKSEK